MATSPLGALRVPDVVYRFYERRLARSLENHQLPGHIGVVLDGNRRWAKQSGASAAYGHQVGAEKIHEFLHWVAEFKIPVVTLYMLSTENLNREKAELEPLIRIIANTLRKLGDGLADGTPLKVHPVVTSASCHQILPNYSTRPPRPPKTIRASTSTLPLGMAVVKKLWVLRNRFLPRRLSPATRSTKPLRPSTSMRSRPGSTLAVSQILTWSSGRLANNDFPGF